MEDTNSFNYQVKSLQFPTCSEEDHEDIPLNKICIDPNCQHQFKITCSACIEEKNDTKHTHKDKFILLKSFLKQLNNFRQEQEEDMLNEQNEYQHSQDLRDQNQQQQQQSHKQEQQDNNGINSMRGNLLRNRNYRQSSRNILQYTQLQEQIFEQIREKKESNEINKIEDQQSQIKQEDFEPLFNNEPDQQQKSDQQQQQQVSQNDQILNIDQSSSLIEKRNQENLQLQKQKQQEKLQELLQDLQKTSKECTILQDTFQQYSSFLKDLMQKLISPAHETPQDQLKHLINQIMETKSYYQQKNNLEENLLKLRNCIEIVNPQKQLGFKLYRELEEQRIQQYLEQVNYEISHIKQNIILTKQYSIPKQIRSIEFQISSFEHSQGIKFDRQHNCYTMEERGRGYIYSKQPISKGKIQCQIRIDELKQNGNFYTGLIKSSELNENPFSPIINQSIHQFSNECGMHIVQNEQNLQRIDVGCKFPLVIDLMLDIDAKQYVIKIEQYGLVFKPDPQGERYITSGVNQNDSFRFTLIWSNIMGQTIYIN